MASEVGQALLRAEEATETVSFSEPGGPELRGYLFRPSFSAAGGAGRHGIVLVHGFPQVGLVSGALSHGYPQLATRLSAETGAVVLAFDFRGAGSSEGDFSLRGWRADLVAAMRTVRALPGVETTWLVGFAAGATLSITAAGEDPGVAGVAAFAPQSEFTDKAVDPRRLVAQARAAGLIRDPAFPPDAGAWARELRAVQPSRLAAKIPPRPLLIVHGASDEVVPLADARELAEAAQGSAELRILAGAGHMLLYDPRAFALLLGWFDRHLGEAA